MLKCLWIAPVIVLFAGCSRTVPCTEPSQTASAATADPEQNRPVETAPAAEEHVSAQASDGQPGKDAQPGIKLLGHNVARCIQSDGAQSKDTRGVGYSHNEAEQ